jgi:hypothetical protein
MDRVIIRGDVYAPFYPRRIAPYEVSWEREGVRFHAGCRASLREAWDLAYRTRRLHSNPALAQARHLIDRACPIEVACPR